MTIQEFSFGNFKSFKDIQTLNLSAAKIVSKNKEIDTTNVIAEENKENISFLKSKAIYGANASGKSNVVDAFLAFNSIVNYSVKDEAILETYIEPFKLSTETENEPSFFQLIFWHKNVKYRYGFEADKENIYAEWLYAKPKDRELPFFIREKESIIELDKTNFSEGEKSITLLGGDSKENQIFRNNSLFLSTLSSFGFGKLSKELVKEITSTLIIGGLGYEGMYKIAMEAVKDKKMKKFIMDFLNYGDIGIEDLDLFEESVDKEYNSKSDKYFEIFNKNRILFSNRKKYDQQLKHHANQSFEFNTDESEGTKKLFELSPFIYRTLKEKRPIIIDEFDARLHPLLTQKIVELFNSKENTGAQLIFCTHDTNLLSSNLLRRDQIEFVEKDKYGASHLYPLVQFKGIRNTASFEKDYIQGKYGAIPFLGDFSQLINMEENAQKD